MLIDWLFRGFFGIDKHVTDYVQETPDAKAKVSISQAKQSIQYNFSKFSSSFQQIILKNKLTKPNIQKAPACDFRRHFIAQREWR